MLHKIICFVANPTMFVQEPDHDTIVMKERSNIMLTCGVQYTYPIPIIKWNITTPLYTNGLYIMQEKFNNNSDYKLYSNGSIEIYHEFLFEVGHIIITCFTNNIHGSDNNKTFHLWEQETFKRSMFYV